MYNMTSNYFDTTMKLLIFIKIDMPTFRLRKNKQIGFNGKSSIKEKLN